MGDDRVDSLTTDPMPITKGKKIGPNTTASSLRTRSDGLPVDIQRQIYLDLEDAQFEFDSNTSLSKVTRTVTENRPGLYGLGDDKTTADVKLFNSVSNKIRRLRERKKSDPSEY